MQLFIAVGIQLFNLTMKLLIFFIAGLFAHKQEAETIAFDSNDIAKLWQPAGLPITGCPEGTYVIGNPAGCHNAHYRNQICCYTAQYCNKGVKNHVCCNIGQYGNKFGYDNDFDLDMCKAISCQV